MKINITLKRRKKVIITSRKKVIECIFDSFKNKFLRDFALKENIEVETMYIR